MAQRTGVFIVRDRSARVVTVWANVYALAQSEGERVFRARMNIVRTAHGIPVLYARGRRSSFLLPRTLQRFQEETGLTCTPVPLDWLEGKAVSLFNKPLFALDRKQRLAVVQWLAEDEAVR